MYLLRNNRLIFVGYKIFTMRYLWMLVLVMGVSSAQAQFKDDVVEKMMTHRILTCEDIFYNSMLLIPRLYAENKVDSIKLVLSYSKRNCKISQAYVAMELLLAIEDRTFNETIKYTYRNDPQKPISSRPPYYDSAYYDTYILSFLETFGEFCTIDTVPELYNHFEYEAYTNYTRFIKNTAQKLTAIKGLSPSEQYLLKYYAHPDSTSFHILNDTIYNGTGLQMAYQERTAIGGVDFGISTGIWSPTGNLSRLGNHPTFGCYIGGRDKGFVGLMNFMIGFTKSPNTYEIMQDDTLFTTNHFEQYYIGYDVAQSIAYNKRHDLAILGGIGYDAIVGLTRSRNGNYDANLKPKVMKTLNLNFGIGYKLFLTHKVAETTIHRSYLGINAKYNIVNYKNSFGTNMSGNTFTITLSYGGLSKSVDTYR